MTGISLVLRLRQKYQFLEMLFPILWAELLREQCAGHSKKKIQTTRPPEARKRFTLARDGAKLVVGHDGRTN